MGKDFKKELEIIKDSYIWGLDVPLNEVIEAIKEVQDYPMITIGSGGSLAVAQFAAMMHQEYTGNISKYITPLDLAVMSYPKNAGFMLITSRGRNKDVIRALEILIEKEPKSIIILTASENSPLTELAKKYNYIRILSLTLPSKKDGFLATNSLYGFCTVLARSYLELYSNGTNLPKTLPTFSLRVKESNSKLFLNLSETSYFLKDRTINVLYSGWASPAAFDLESKFSEAALGHVQITDYRNFGHGRHNWLDKRGDSTCVLLFVTPECKLLAEQTIKTIPSKVPIITIESDKEGVLATLSLILGVFEVVKIFGDLLGVNPGSPKVAEFGRKLYHLGLKNHIKPFNKTIVKNQNYRLWIERKISNNRLNNEIVKRDLFGIAEKHLIDYIQNLTSTQFGGLILDYDGTLCEPEKRFDKPPENIIKEIIRLLNSNIIIGIATGRGKSVRETLQPLIPKNRWKQVIIGYYNGGDIGDLSENNIPDKNANIDTMLEEFIEATSNSDLIRNLKYEIRPCQIKIELNKYYSLDYLYELLTEIKLKLELTAISIVKSSHSLDILAPNVSKTRIITNIRLRLDDDINELPILAIGDKGKWPGNDFDLLINMHSLSVDECSTDLDSGWNVAPIGHKRTQATFDYLRALQPKSEKIFTLDFDLLRAFDHEE